MIDPTVTLALAAAVGIMLAWMATTSTWPGRRAVELATVGAVLMAVVGVPYLADTAGDLISRGRASITGFKDDATEPTALNTGVKPGIFLAPLNGNQVITVAGTLLENRIIYGYVEVRAANVTLRNCQILGSSDGTYGAGGIVQAVHSAVSNLQLERCTIRPQAPSSTWIGIQGHHYKAYRCDISGTVDPTRIYNTTNPSQQIGVEISCNYAHDWYYQSPFSGHSDGQTHNDGTQQEDGRGAWIHGNALWAYCDSDISSPTTTIAKIANSSGKGNGRNVLAILQVGANAGIISDLLFEKNWCYGGSVKIQIAQKGRGAMSGIVIRNNRIADDGTVNNVGLVDNSTLTACVASWTGNVFHVGPRAGQTIPNSVSTTGFASRTDS